MRALRIDAIEREIAAGDFLRSVHNLAAARFDRRYRRIDIGDPEILVPMRRLRCMIALVSSQCVGNRVTVFAYR